MGVLQDGHLKASGQHKELAEHNKECHQTVHGERLYYEGLKMGREVRIVYWRLFRAE